jgi:hypothetical protein
MNAIRIPQTTLAAALLVACAAGISTAQAQGPVLKSSNPAHFEQWYGRAGGEVGAERVETLNAPAVPPASVSITYDKDVAARTNMQRNSVDNKEIGITYDQAVAERTNMERAKKEASPAVAKSQQK